MAAHDAVLERMRTNDVRRAWLRVFTANGRGRAFYEKLGWRWTGERSVSTFAPYPELLHYERDLWIRGVELCSPNSPSASRIRDARISS